MGRLLEIFKDLWIEVRRLADCLIKYGGFTVDTDKLTAGPEDVAEGDTFMGSGSDTIQTGSIPVKGSPAINFGFNDSITLPQGIYDGGTVAQHIATMGRIEVTPGGKTINVATKDMYMTGDVYIKPLHDLIPANIKKGEYVGGVGPGEWEGYNEADPAYLYYRGYQKSGYEAILLGRWRVNEYYPQGQYYFYKDKMHCYLQKAYKQNNQMYYPQCMIGFAGSLNFGALSKITISARIDHIPTPGKGVQIYAFAFTNFVTDFMASREDPGADQLNPNIGTSLAPRNPDMGSGYYGRIWPQTFAIFKQDYAAGADIFTADITSFSGTGYLYLGFSNDFLPLENANFYIESVKIL